MSNFNEVILSMIGTIAIINLIAVVLQGKKRILRKDEGNGEFKVAINLGIVGGLFGIYATLKGYTIDNGSIITIRDVGPMMAGCLAGPLGGLIAGLIAGIHRLFQGYPDIFSGTTIPCTISTILIGLICGVLFKPFEKNNHKGLFAFAIAILMEILHLIIVFIYVAISENCQEGFYLIKDVAISFLFANSLAFGLIIFMTDMIDKYRNIEKNEESIEVELKTATNIQKSMLPAISHDFPGRTEFDIYSSMTAAKQVGGDFYDLFFIDDDHFVFLVSDVSGKGVPSALFMVIAKTIIKNNLQLGLNFKDAIEKSNQQLYDGNKESMFVTSWIGILEISTGKLQYINAGHNPPVLKKATGEAMLLKEKSGVVLAAKKDSGYNVYETKLEKNDIMFLYTDGVTEALNISNEQYGENRLIDIINSKCNDSVENICKSLKNDIDKFSKDVEQFDDITMLCLRYNKGENKGMDLNIKMQEITLEAFIPNMDKVINFVEDQIQEFDCSNKILSQINIIIDEIWGNICKYAYKENENGFVTIKTFITYNPSMLHIVFEDKGIQYNPLNFKKIDKSLSASEREYGGLGIGITKELSDNINYEYIDGKNILTISKLL